MQVNLKSLRLLFALPGCCGLGVARGFSGWVLGVLGPLVAAASAGSMLRSLGSFGWFLICTALRWGAGSVAWGIVALQGFSLKEFFETEQSATYCSLVF